jgi:hypothetical protein
MNSCSSANRDTIIQEGKIMTIDPVLHKVYVEIPAGIRPFIIMGEVNSSTAFLKDGYPARLSDFSEGEPVLVQWKNTKNNQVIVMIEAKRHAYKYGRLRDGSKLLP